MKSTRTTKNTVPVGATPVSLYDSWEDHREAIRLEAVAFRATAAARQLRRASASP